MAGNIPITTRTGIGLPGLATITAAHTQAMEAAAVGVVLPAMADPVVMAVGVPRVAAIQVAVTITMIHRLLPPPYSAIRAGGLAPGRAAVIGRHPLRYIGVRSRIVESEIVSNKSQGVRTRVRASWLLSFCLSLEVSIKSQ